MRHSDEDITGMICQGGEALSKALRILYDRHRREMIGRLRKDMGSEAEDIFHETLVILVENVLDGRFSGKSSLATYLWAIAHNLCLRRHARSARDERYVNHFSGNETHATNPEIDYIDEQLRDSVEQMLEKLPPQCREILRLWMRKYSMQEIAEQLNYENAVVVRNVKSRCLKKIAGLIGNDPALREVLEEWIKND
ncbi:MAG: sigma-70 family RNA polymerase sigma factor [Bacteroidia bacterium]|nr:sigma-70 family RNA polymerase sigma factor [Bacteroidia bacterium]